MKKGIIAIILVLSMIIVLFTGCTVGNNVEADSNEEEQKAYIPVEVGEAKFKTLVNTTNINGRVFADKDIMVMPTIPGKVKTLAVKDGDYVNKGDVLFTIDEKDIRKQVDQAKVAYEMATANYNLSQEQTLIAHKSLEQTKELTESVLNNARENLENTKKLFEAGAISKSQLEQAELALQQQETQLQSQLNQAELGASDQVMEIASAQLEQAKLAYNQAQEALNNATITSPTSGIVTGVSIEVGSMASNAQPAMNIVDMERVYVRIDIVEGLINKLEEGKEVKVNVPAASSEAFPSVIDSIIPAPDLRTQLYPVKIYIDNSDGKVKPGMFANVEVPLDVKEDVLSVSGQSVIIKNGENVVYIVESGKAVEKRVEIGLDTGTEVEILNGLKEGDTIITNGHNYVRDGGDVKIVGRIGQ